MNFSIVRTRVRQKQRETRFFIQNTPPEVQFRDSLFEAEFSVNPCETATKGTKKTACNRQHFCKQRICSGGGEVSVPESFSSSKSSCNYLVYQHFSPHQLSITENIRIEKKAPFSTVLLLLWYLLPPLRNKVVQCISALRIFRRQTNIAHKKIKANFIVTLLLQRLQFR